MYSVYSVLVVVFFALVSPWVFYQAIRYRKYIGSLSQRMGYLPVSFNMDANHGETTDATRPRLEKMAKLVLPRLK